MVMRSDETISTLNHLIEMCKDSEKSFRTVVEVAEDNTLKSGFTTYAERRVQFVDELQKEVRRHGGDPEASGSARSAMHRGLTHLKTIVTADDARAFIAECERSEAKAMQGYKSALKKDLPADVREILDRQGAEIEETHATLCELQKAPH